MTRNKDFKAVVRARAARTGETYTAARAAMIAAADAARADAAERQRVIIRRWFADGRLRSIPARRKVRAAVLLEILGRFAPGRSYPESEISRLLAAVHPDFASLRRDLVAFGYVVRNGGVYRVTPSAPIRRPHEAAELPAWEGIWLPEFIRGGRTRAPETTR